MEMPERVTVFKLRCLPEERRGQPRRVLSFACGPVREPEELVQSAAERQRPVQARRGSGRRLIVPHPEHAVRRLDFVTGAPPRNESVREGGI
jgi:hypothetical protein